MQKLLRRRGLLRVVTTVPAADQTMSKWAVCGKQEESTAQKAELLTAVEGTARCQTKLRSAWIYEEIPQARVKYKDFWVPIILALAVLVVSYWSQSLVQIDEISQSAAAFVLEAAATIGFGYAGWLFSRGFWGQRITPLGCTAVKQSIRTVISLVLLVGLLSLITMIGFELWQTLPVNLIKWVTDPAGRIAELLGWFWWPLLGLGYGFFSGMAIWRTEESRRAFEQGHPRLDSAVRRFRLRKIASWILWRVDLKDIVCFCNRHVPPSSGVS